MAERNAHKVERGRGGPHEQERLEDRSRRELAAEAAGLGMWCWEIRPDRVWMNGTCRRMFGFGEGEEITRAAVLARVHPEDRSLAEVSAAKAMRTGDRFEVEYRLHSPGKAVRWIASRGRVERDGDGATRMHGVSIDVSERRLAEERFRLALEAAPSAMVVVARDGRIVMVNARTEALFGPRRDELVGLAIGELVPDLPFEAGYEFREPSGLSPDLTTAALTWEGLGRRKDGSPVPLELGLNPFRTSEGAFVLISIVDLTERRRADAELARQRSELAHLSRVNMLGELSGSLAHELNQPLTAILSNAQAAQRFLAQSPVDLNEIGEILKDIVAEDKRAGDVIQRLRVLLKKGQVQQQALSINDVVQDVLKLVRSDLINQQVEVETDLANGLAPISGDRVQLQQVILNLVVNACDAMDRTRGPERKVTVRTQSSGASGVVFSITDRGHGIPAEELDAVFEPFYTTKPQGLGLGLSVCRTIVTAHGGRLWATNNPDGGATFHMALPAAGEKGTDARQRRK